MHGLDPLSYLALSADDFQVVTAVLNRTTQLVDQRQRALADYQAGRTAGLTAQAITRWFGRTFKRMFSSSG